MAIMKLIEEYSDDDIKNILQQADEIERTDPKESTFSPSSIETARCMRRFYYEKVLKMKPKTTPVALVYGIAIHEAVEKFYQLRAGGNEDIMQVKLEVVQQFTKTWTKFGINGDNKRDLRGGILTMSNYVDLYFADVEDFDIEDIETKQWLPMPNGTTMLVKLDRIFNKKNLREVHDTKTTSMPITEYWFRQFENHLPTTLYFYTIRELLGSCDTIVIDAIKVPPPPASSVTAPFGRATFLRTDLQVHDAINTYVSRSDYIMASLNKPESQWADRFYCNQGECDKYGGCPFLSVCKHGLDHPSVQVDFDIG